MDIPLCKPYIGEEEIKIVSDVLKSGWLAHGPKTKDFEKKFAEYIGIRNAVSVNSCTSALQLAIQAMELKGEIILPSFTFSASANAVVTSGCKPIFVDIGYDTCNIDSNKIKSKINKDTVAIMPVHFAGQCCKMDEIMEIAEKNNLVVIEDSAECIGGTFKNKKSGAFAIGCFSFYPTKNITTGEGGMITSNDDDLIQKASALKAHGVTTSAFEREKKQKPWFRAASFAGYNYRLCDILSAIGLIQLDKLDEMNSLRRKHASYLNKNLKFQEIELPIELKECKHVYQMYTIKLKENIDRDFFVRQLNSLGIGASVHFDPPVHLQPYYKNQNLDLDLPITESVSNSIVTLPMYPQLTREQLDKIICCVEKALKCCRK